MLCVSLYSVFNATPHTMKPSPVPLTESLFSVSRAWLKEKTLLQGEAITKRCPVIFKQGRWDRRAKPHWRCSCWQSTTSSERFPLLDFGFIPTHTYCNLMAMILIFRCFCRIRFFAWSTSPKNLVNKLGYLANTFCTRNVQNVSKKNRGKNLFSKSLPRFH